MSDQNQIELAVLGSLIFKPDLCDQVTARVRSTDFLNPANRAIFDHLIELRVQQKPVDDVRFVSDSLKSRGLIGDGVTTVSGDDLRLAAREAKPANIEYYLDQLIYWSQVRSLKLLRLELDSRLLTPYVDVQEVTDFVGRKIEEIHSRDRMTTKLLSEASEEVLKGVVQTVATGGVGGYGRSCVWGMNSIDQLVNPLEPGDLCLLCARPSGGKTAGAVQILMANAEVGKRCLFVSMEQRSSELALRLLAGATGISVRRIKSGQLSNEDLERLYDEAGRYRNCHIEVFDGGKINIRQIRSLAKLMASRGGIDLLAVDYLQYIAPIDFRQPTNEQIRDSTDSLKALARELSMPVICLAQLNRKAESEAPTMAHIKGSGDAEQSADVVALIHNPREHADSLADRPARWIFAKVRNGGTGDIALTWSPTRTKFVDVSVEEI